MGAAENAALIQRFYDEGWNANNLDVYEELVTPDFVDHQALPGLEPGREGFKMLNVMFRSAFPDVWVDRRPDRRRGRQGRLPLDVDGDARGRPLRHPADGQQGQGHRDGLVPDRGRQARRGLDQPRRRRSDAPARRDPLAVGLSRAAAVRAAAALARASPQRRSTDGPVQHHGAAAQRRSSTARSKAASRRPAPTRSSAAAAGGLLLAIASRETNCRDIVGDGGLGRGVFQIDDRARTPTSSPQNAGPDGIPPIPAAAISRPASSRRASRQRRS